MSDDIVVNMNLNLGKDQTVADIVTRLRETTPCRGRGVKHHTKKERTVLAVTIELGWKHLILVGVSVVTAVATNILLDWWENRD